MSPRTSSGLLLVAIVSAGCSWSAPSRQTSSAPFTPLATQVAASTAPLRRSWQQLSQAESRAQLPRWDWVTGIPADISRAESLGADVAAESVAALFPSLQQPPVQLTSTHSLQRSLRIVNVGGREVRNCADLYAALELANDPQRLQVDFQRPDGREIAVATDRVTARALISCAAPAFSMLRIADHGNPSIIIREPTIHCELMTRVERSRGILQLVLTCQKIGGGEALIPREVRAACDGQPLRCVTVSEVLELLYLPSATRASVLPTDGSDQSCSFAFISNQDDYLIPINYKRLSAELEAKNINTNPDVLVPAFAAVSKTVYPGPAMLGDARALAGIMVQQQLLSSQDGERTGWVVFAGESLRGGGTLEVHIDFGAGFHVVRCQIPAP